MNLLERRSCGITRLVLRHPSAQGLLQDCTVIAPLSLQEAPPKNREKCAKCLLEARIRVPRTCAALFIHLVHSVDTRL